MYIYIIYIHTYVSNTSLHHGFLLVTVYKFCIAICINHGRGQTHCSLVFHLNAGFSVDVPLRPWWPGVSHQAPRRAHWRLGFVHQHLGKHGCWGEKLKCEQLQNIPTIWLLNFVFCGNGWLIDDLWLFTYIWKNVCFLSYSILNN